MALLTFFVITYQSIVYTNKHPNMHNSLIISSMKN